MTVTGRPTTGRGAAVALGALLLAAGAGAPVAATTDPATAGGDDPAAGDSGGAPDTAPGSDAGLATPQTSSEGVEVATHGVVQVRSYQEAGRAPVTMAVHAVQRVEGGTVVYLSVGYTDPAADASPIALSETAGPGERFTSGGELTDVRVVVPEAGLVLATVPAPGGSGTSSQPFASGLTAFPDEPGVMAVTYAVLPALPDATDTVDVQLGFGAVVPDVPVGEGVLEPAADPESVVPLGTGWPEVDEAAVTAVDSPEESVYELAEVTEALDASSVTTETTDEVTIDVAADVLFAFDSADLSAEARATLDGVATEISDRAAPGTVTIVGHTDSNASEAYNDDLSLRRAQAVADVLEPALAGSGLELVVEGRGEREPVADNSSEEGRQANRRVSVTFSVDAEGPS